MSSVRETSTKFVLTPDLSAKRERLEARLISLESVIVAFSGGVDSALLLTLARRALGDRCLALTAVSPSLPRREMEDAIAFARALGVEHRLIATQELTRAGFVENTGQRCFFCKSELFDQCFSLAEKEGYRSVVYGATLDDLGDHRPGMRAARERGAQAPLLDAGMSKDAVRTLSRALGIRLWDKPAMACLSSRIPYGTRVTADRLSRIERAEDELYALGFREYRVRFHGDLARIELAPSEWSRIQDETMRQAVSTGLRQVGFRFVSLDLLPFVSGSLNRILEAEE